MYKVDRLLKMELITTDKGEYVRLEYGNRVEIREERKYRVEVGDKGVMVEAQPD
jgi:hypothetical protein